ncbi:MAG TPA: GNAT family N-acetyltransferase [Candidatus Binatia bacterium]|nr:GNAT family N-acetyltransferase [Candidatus Binatia bacterium]
MEAFPSFAKSWDEINRQSSNHILLDSRFIAPLVRHFGSERTLLAVRGGSEAPGMALIERGKPGFWQTFQPGQAPLGAIVLGRDHDDPGVAIRELIRDLPGYALGFSVTQQDPDFTCFTNLNGSLPFETLDYIQTPRLTVGGSFEAYWKSRSKNLTHNLSRQRRRLKEQGAVLELVVDRCADAVAGAIQEYGDLESSGWKGRQGSAVAADNVQGRFYREMLEDFCSTGEAVIYRLRLNGQTVAADLCLERSATLFILKTAYDESIQGLSLGMLLHREMFQRLFDEKNVHMVEFYGQLRDWHTKWTTEVRRMYHINFYRFLCVAYIRKAMPHRRRIQKFEM